LAEARLKGIVFTEFLEMVEARFSADMVDDIIDDAHSATGVYTAVGSYPHSEMVALVSALSRRSRLSVPELLRAYGEYLFGRFAVLYPHFFEGVPDSLTFLAGIEDIIHAEVRKLYPDAELPRFVVEARGENHVVLRYASGRHLEDLAEGLIRGCAMHFGEAIAIHRETIGSGDGRQERFTMIRSA
jgi:hypothetical protein